MPTQSSLPSSPTHKSAAYDDYRQSPVAAQGIRYIGSKARISAQIIEAGASLGIDGRFVDLFCGTGVVSSAASTAGWPVLANDFLLSAASITEARLVSKHEIGFQVMAGYTAALNQLSRAEPKIGPITSEYSPAGLSRSGHERLYFTPENAKRIDAIRSKIDEFIAANRITERERTLLIADLLLAANRVANTAGTYGCFLRRWAPNSLMPLRLVPRALHPSDAAYTVICGDAFELRDDPEDTLYIDPPYTKRQYAAYYHVLETIAAGDWPLVGGVTGLRPWHSKSSPFCYKKKALKAFDDLLESKRARKIIVSYSSEGHVELGALAHLLSRHGQVSVTSVGEIARYSPNDKARENGVTVSEYLILVNRSRGWRRS